MLESSVVWQFVHWYVWLNREPASFSSASVVLPLASVDGKPASSSDTAGPSCWPASHSSKSLGLCAITRKRMLAWDRPQYSAHCPRYVPALSMVNDVWLLWPGTTSRLPLSSGTQKLWITL